jgi:hypothetical protein
VKDARIRIEGAQVRANEWSRKGEVHYTVSTNLDLHLQLTAKNLLVLETNLQCQVTADAVFVKVFAAVVEGCLQRSRLSNDRLPDAEAE